PRPVLTGHCALAKLFHRCRYNPFVSAFARALAPEVASPIVVVFGHSHPSGRTVLVHGKIMHFGAISTRSPSHPEISEHQVSFAVWYVCQRLIVRFPLMVSEPLPSIV